MREGTMKSLAPSGVLLPRMGVSISMNFCDSRYCLARCRNLLLNSMAWIISDLLRSRYLYFMRTSSPGRTPSFWSPISSGGMADLLSSLADLMRTSIAPVGLRSSSVPSTLFLTVPFTCTTDSLEKVSMTAPRAFTSTSLVASGSKTTCVIPYLSARSMKATPPWSLENLTQP